MRIYQAWDDDFARCVDSLASRSVSRDFGSCSDCNNLAVLNRNRAVLNHSAIFVHRDDRSADDQEIDWRPYRRLTNWRGHLGANQFSYL